MPPSAPCSRGPDTCNPNNPTGQMIQPELLEAVCAVCGKRGIRLFMDECFLELSDAGRGASLAKWLDRYPNLFLLKDFTLFPALDIVP